MSVSNLGHPVMKRFSYLKMNENVKGFFNTSFYYYYCVIFSLHQQKKLLTATWSKTCKKVRWLPNKCLRHMGLVGWLAGWLVAFKNSPSHYRHPHHPSPTLNSFFCDQNKLQTFVFSFPSWEVFLLLLLLFVVWVILTLTWTTGPLPRFQRSGEKTLDHLNTVGQKEAL